MGYLGDNSTHYFIPGIGIYNLDIERAKPVKILYDFLDEVGEIDRLKNLDHLGDVREVIDGTRHSRFDYIALIFALIDNWAQIAKEIHAFSKVEVEPEIELGERKLQGKDLIKCWALLLNIGHLDWTFPTKRILLEVLHDKKLYTKLIEGIEDEEIKKKAKEILELRDYNHFYQILAYLRFKCLYEKYRDKIDEIWFKRYEWMLKKYIVDDFSDKVKESKIIHFKNLYRNVRRIAFLLLDSFYTPSGLNLSPVLLFGNPELMLSIVFDEAEISNTLKFLNRQLYKSVYLNEKVLAIHSLYYSPLKEELLRRVENLKNEENVCESIEEIYERLNIQKIRKENRKRKSEYVPIMRFEFEGGDLGEQLKEELYKSPLVEINSNSGCYKVVWKTSLNFYVIQYNSKSNKQSSIATFKESFDTVKKFLKDIKDKYTFDEAKFGEAKKLLEDLRNKFSETDCTKSLIEFMENCTKSLIESIENIENKYGEASYIEHKRDVIERIAKKYIEQALKLSFNNEDIRWEWDHTSFLRSYFNFPDAVIGFADDVREFYRKNIVSKFNEKHNETSELYREKMKSIKKELEAKLEVVKILKYREKSIKGKPDILCITISNLIAYSVHSGNKLMEVDGLILGLTTEKQLFICLIEAKSGNEGATRAVRSKIRDRENDIFRGYDVFNLISSVKGLDDNSIAYLIITDEKIPTI
jgi:anion-transporting  ArsA/GET3 family ATPase